MAPRIVESDYDDDDDDDDEVDELASDSSSAVSRSAAAAARAAPVQSAKATAITTSSRSRQQQPSKRQTVATRAAPKNAPPAPIAASSRARPARQAAQKANESMDIDAQMDSGDDEDDDDEEQDELAEPPIDQFLEDDEEEEEENTQLEQDELDDLDDLGEEYAESPTTSALQPPSSATKIKLTIGANKKKGGSAVITASSPATTASSKKGSKAKATKSKKASGSKKGKAKAAAPSQPALPKPSTKRKREEYEDPLMMDMDGVDEGEDVPIPDEDDEELDFLSDDSNKSDVSFSKMTARQRAAAIGDNVDLMQLPSAPSKKKVLTADEVAMRKVETSRRRKHLLNKKLEEEKAETIERLLKKPIGKKSGASTSRLAAQTKVEKVPATLPVGTALDNEGVALSEEALVLQQQQQVAALPTMFRWISSIKGNKYQETWAVPSNLADRFSWPAVGLANQTLVVVDGTTSEGGEQPVYPPPRPPPKTRMLKAS